MAFPCDIPQFSLHTTREKLGLNIPFVKKLKIFNHGGYFSPHSLPIKDSLVGEWKKNKLKADSRYLTDLQPEEEGEVLRHSETVKQDIVLRADTKVPTNLIHVSENIITADGGRPTCGSVQTWEREKHKTS